MRLTVLVFCALLCCALPAEAEARQTPETAEGYAETILLVDLGTIVFTGGMLAAGIPQVAVFLGPTLFVVGGPAVHASKQRGTMALASAGLRLGLPSALAAAGWHLADDFDSRPSRAIGLGLIGLLTASVIDATVLAGPPASKTARTSPVQVGVAHTHNGVALGVSGRF